MIYFLLVSILIISLLGIGLVFLRRNLKSHLSLRKLWLPGEKFFLDPKSNSKFEFPSVQDPSSIYLSVIAPAYNEQQRLPTMLDETLKHLQSRHSSDPAFTWEIIIVDDGSKDETANVALQYVEKEGCERVRLLKLQQNCGKGGAVKRGMLCGRGKYLLMVDADGATKFSELDKLERRLKAIEKDGFGVAVGSRSQESEVKKSIFRNILTFGFYLLVQGLCVRGVKDTQCGFKLFSRESANLLFSVQHIERFAFDVELLFLAQTHKMPIAEVGVHWTEIAGSKVDPFWDSLKMAKDLVNIRLMYLLSIWSPNRDRANHDHP